MHLHIETGLGVWKNNVISDACPCHYGLRELLSDKKEDIESLEIRL